MKLFYNDLEDCWCWVSDKDENNELSPCFDEEQYALKWLIDIADEFHKEYESTIRLPTSKEYAKRMIQVAQFYLEQHND